MNDPDSSELLLVGIRDRRSSSASQGKSHPSRLLEHSAALCGAALTAPTVLAGCGGEDGTEEITGGGDYAPGNPDLQVDVLPTPEDLKNTAWREWRPLYKSMSQRHSEAVQESNPSVEPILFRAAELYEPFATPEESGVPPLVLDLDQSAQIDEITTNLESHLKQTMASFGNGEKDASKDADWEEYLSTAKAIGIETYTEIHQATYDAQYG